MLTEGFWRPGTHTEDGAGGGGRQSLHQWNPDCLNHSITSWQSAACLTNLVLFIFNYHRSHSNLLTSLIAGKEFSWLGSQPPGQYTWLFQWKIFIAVDGSSLLLGLSLNLLYGWCLWKTFILECGLYVVFNRDLLALCFCWHYTTVCFSGHSQALPPAWPYAACFTLRLKVWAQSLPSFLVSFPSSLCLPSP